jgi:hypothetical protein
MSAFRGPDADHSRTNKRGDDGFAGFQSIQKMLARELHMNVPAAMCSRRSFGVIRQMRVLTS